MLRSGPIHLDLYRITPDFKSYGRMGAWGTKGFGMLSIMKKLGLLVAVLALGACANTFSSEVSTFHEAPPAPGKSFAITPMNPDKTDSIEFARYAAMIVAEMERVGYRPAREGESSDLVVGFDVVQSEGREEIYSRPATNFNVWFGGAFYGQWRAFYRPGLYGGPFLGGPFVGGGFQRELDTRTIFPTTLFVEIRDAGDGDLSFEGRAITHARNRALNETMPLLTHTLFTEYPGPDGGTRRVKLTLADDGTVEKESIKSLALNSRTRPGF